VHKCSATTKIELPSHHSRCKNALVKEQSVGMQISIVQGVADGTIVYSETQNQQAISTD